MSLYHQQVYLGKCVFRMSTMAWEDYSRKLQKIFKDICHEYGFTYVGAVQVTPIYREWGFDMRLPIPAVELLNLEAEKSTEFIDKLKMACFNTELYCTFDLKEAEQ